MKQILAFALLFVLGAPTAFAQIFRADDPVRVDDDTVVNIKSIAKHKLNDQYDFLQHTFGKPGDRTASRAVNINTLGEVPDSSWFQNRHAARPMSLNALVQGPDTGAGPSMEGPWTVIGAKTEGITPGFRIRDPRGDVYFMKFDPPGNPEMATAAEVISTKFFYALGYNVPENYLAWFTRGQLRVDAKAKVADSTGRERPLTEADFDAILKSVHRSADGTYRAVASKLLRGTPVGPFQYHGTRPDDPNDIFAHEHRRELRGLRVFSAWLNHDDSRAINSLDMLVEEEGRRFVRHYLIDFGSTLGSGSVGAQKPRAGWEYMFEPSAALKRIVSLGLWDKKWVRVPYPAYDSIGRFEATYFEAKDWKPEYPNPAFSNATDQDTYWAARAVMAFSDDEIRAIVKTGRLSNPEAEEYLVRTLSARRDKIGRYWLTRLSSFDRFAVVDGELRFAHLASEYDFAPRPAYRVAWFSVDPVSGLRQPVDDAAKQDCPLERSECKPDRAQPVIEAEGYFVAQITSVEGNVDVFIRNRNGRSEVVGVER
jgi:hypothetical protein